jgi:magnesium chelatase family protein
MARVSGPILDRIDIRINVPQVTALELSNAASQEGSAEVRKRVEAARQLQHRRYETLFGGKAVTNAECPPALLERIAEPDQPGQRLLHDAASAFGLSARGYHRTLRVARTLADLDGLEKVHKEHIAEALALRGADGGLLGARQSAKAASQVALAG